MTTIHHVNLAVDDLATATEFYRDVLGLDPIATPDLGFPAQFFAIAPGQELHVNQLDDVHQQRTHFCLRLDDFAGVVDRAATAGANGIRYVLGQPSNRIGGYREAVFRHTLHNGPQRDTFTVSHVEARRRTNIRKIGPRLAVRRHVPA